MADCGCNVSRLETPFGDDIDYCSLHAAAPDLLAALEEIANYHGQALVPAVHMMTVARCAIAKAKGE
jgi:hypothetical protein